MTAARGGLREPGRPRPGRSSRRLRGSSGRLLLAQASEEIGRADITSIVPATPGETPALCEASILALYDNGPLVTHPGGGAGGADASRLQNSSLLMSTLGFTASTATAFRIAGDFTVPAPGWTVNSVTFLAYQTGSTTKSTLNGARVQI